MSAFLRKYGVATAAATHVRIPIVKRAAVDFAVSADWTPAAGDVTISKDGAAAANIGTLPTALTMGNSAVWVFQFTATELQAKQIVVTISDAATKTIEDQSFIIETYGHPSALHPFDLGTATQPVNVIQFGGLAGTFAAGVPEVNAVQWGGAAVSGVVVNVNVVQFGGVVGNFNAGRAEVNVSHVAGQTQTPRDLGALIDVATSTRANPAEVNAEVVDVLVTDTHGQLAGVPGITCSIRDMVRWMFTLSRNKITQTDALTTLRNDADNADLATAAVSDDGTTATRGKYT